MQALDIIRAEHRGMWRMLSAIDVLRERLPAPGRPAADVAADVAGIRRMLDYFERFSDALHHPKEDDHLFARLQQRHPPARALVDRLHREHVEGAKAVGALVAQAEAAARGEAAAVAAFAESLSRYVERARAHIRTEETEAFPLAKAHLDAADWSVIDAVFADHADPVFGDGAKAEFDALRRQVVALAPEPVGFGGDASVRVADVVPLPGARADVPVLEVDGLVSHYGRIQALHGVSLRIERAGQLVALVGANGAGKTTLLRTLSGVQRATGGRVRFLGQDITGMAPAKRVGLGICQVPEGRQVFGPMSIEDNLRLGAYTRPKQEIDRDLERMYALFPVLKEKRRLPAGTLSGGQQQMVAMARALMGAPKLLLLDEPSMGLAPLLVEEIFRVIRVLKDAGTTILLVEQNAHAALALSDTGYVLETGRVTMQGPGRALLADERVREAYLGM